MIIPFGKEHGSETRSAPDGQLLTIAFTMLEQLCGPKARGMEIGEHQKSKGWRLFFA